jgi:hypothetical protein
LWLDFPLYRSVIEEKVDWIAYKLALREMFWITPGYSSDSEVSILMGAFQRNLDAFVLPRIIFRTVDPRLLSTPLHQLSRDEQLLLRTKLLVFGYSNETLIRGSVPLKYEGIDVSSYGCFLQPYETRPPPVMQDEIFV